MTTTIAYILISLAPFASIATFADEASCQTFLNSIASKMTNPTPLLRNTDCIKATNVIVTK